MHKVLKFLLFLFLSPIASMAQNKYAVLVAINDYYDKAGVKGGHSLSGCINDANAIKGLLQNRFGFNPANIETVYNAQATKKNVIDRMHSVLNRCKAGDVLVFYYSGHGAWMSNAMNARDVVKRGMSQAMVMSDLYSPNLDCLLTDEMAKQLFDEFVDKKVIVTAIFDCCYAGNIPMLPLNDYWAPSLNYRDRSIGIDDIDYVPPRAKPNGCAIDVSGHIKDTLDSDHDGVPDCKDWEIDTPAFYVVDSLGILKDRIPGSQFPGFNFSDPGSANDSVAFSANTTRSFNLKDALRVWYPSIAQRPSERKNSAFLSISATSDVEKGLEITDESGVKHGAFTKALLQVYRESFPDLPVSDLLKKIAVLMEQQGYGQQLSHHEMGRLQGNLIGINSLNFSNALKATCISVKGDTITIDKGLNDGVTKGNIFTTIDVPGHKKIEIINAYSDSALAINKTASASKGDKFEMNDAYTSSSMLVKIFIPTADVTAAGFDAFFKNKILPLVKQENYGDYYSQYNRDEGLVTVYSDVKKSYRFRLPSNSEGRMIYNYILLPVPSNIAKIVKSSFAKDQNIQFVDNVSNADYVMYINYKKEHPGVKPEFLFYFHPPVWSDAPIFSYDMIGTPSLNITGQSLSELSQKLVNLTKNTIRYKTTTWINTYPKR